MKLYDTINGVYISEDEIEKTDVVQAVHAGEYSKYDLENWTVEGDQVGNSTQLADLKKLGYAYFSGDSGSVIACSDGRHVDTVWNTGCWDEGDDTSDREVWASRFESLKTEMELREAYFEETKLTASDAEVAAYHEAHGQALEFALNCVNDEITVLYPNADFSDMEYCIMDYVGDHVGWNVRSLNRE